MILCIGVFDLRNGFADSFADGQTYSLTDGFPDGLAESFANGQIYSLPDELPDGFPERSDLRHLGRPAHRHVRSGTVSS